MQLDRLPTVLDASTALMILARRRAARSLRSNRTADSDRTRLATVADAFGAGRLTNDKRRPNSQYDGSR